MKVVALTNHKRHREFRVHHLIKTWGKIDLQCICQEVQENMCEQVVLAMVLHLIGWQSAAITKHGNEKPNHIQFTNLTFKWKKQ